MSEERTSSHNLESDESGLLLSVKPISDRPRDPSLSDDSDTTDTGGEDNVDDTDATDAGDTDTTDDSDGTD